MSKDERKDETQNLNFKFGKTGLRFTNIAYCVKLQHIKS